ncbi:unnamed protein product [Cyprideis torosa]|uniref:Aminotransferase class I/classII large domain-containing protein n=1 Tax=Cyprideis torosa TaxID=163714 RepID=A0A7R8WNE8_9CRUS|nr:unnamed protein product [Cyprideis torosa]CAG0906136.1 unnamed protein product [Cyprideis torosa]
MDGDTADLLELVRIKKDFDCLLYIDEAHAFGMYGAQGLGKAEEFGVVDEVDLLVSTFGKAGASIGAFVVCETEIYRYLVNFSRSLIFTTALPPVVVHWNTFVLNTIRTVEGKRVRVRALAERMRHELRSRGLQTAGDTNIVPVFIGHNQRCVDLAEKLQAQGYFVLPIRPPTVPENTARFRLSLTANMEWDELEALPELISSGVNAL